MNNENNTEARDHLSLTRRPWRILVIAVVALVAFLLGGLIMGGGSAASEFAEDVHATTEMSQAPQVWTCSMHPQIQLPKPGKCPICFMDLIPVESGGGDELPVNQIKLSAAARQLAGISTTPVVRAYAERDIRMVGKLDYDESKLAYVTAWVPGRLERLYADYTGMQVARGDHMVEIYSPELISAQEELLQARKAVATLDRSSSKTLQGTANETLRSAREKLKLYGLSEEQIAQIEESGEAAHNLTLTSPIGGVVVHKEAKEGMYVATGTRIYTLADLSELWVLFEAYESDLPWLRYGQHVSFTSPSFPGETFDAIISFIDPVVTPATRTVNVRAIVKNSGGRLKPEMFVTGYVNARLDAAGNVIAPQLANKWISPMHPQIVKDHPGTCDVCGMKLVPAAELGYSTGAGSEGTPPLTIPATAPLITGKRAVVYVELSGGDDIFEGREVTLGPKAGDNYIVKDGLAEGEIVVTHGAFKIDSEMQIQAKPSMMSAPDMKSEQHHVMAAAAVEKKQAPAKPYVAGTAARIEVSAAALGELTEVYHRYFDIQMALAKDDLKAAKNAYDTLEKTIAAVDESSFTGHSQMRWTELSALMVKHTSGGAAAKSIEEARDAFFYLSQQLIELHDTFGHSSEEPFYLTFCPMARNNAGAYWLQQADIVWNSFYGDMMLRCGEIKQKLPTNGGTTEK